MLNRLESLLAGRGAPGPRALGLTLGGCLLVGGATPVPPDSSDSHSLDVPGNRALQPVLDRLDLPRVLLIGDSISIAYTLPLRDRLQGAANVHRIPQNGGPTSPGLTKLDTWLGTNQWDVIHFRDRRHRPVQD